jgi:hypothetical protein
MLAPSVTGRKDERLNKIISVMKNDCFSKIVQKDPLVKAFGSTMIGKNRTKRWPVHFSENKRAWSLSRRFNVG